VGGSGDQPSLHLTFTVLATTLGDIFRAMMDSVAARTELARELPPNALRDEWRTAQTVADAVGELARLTGEVDVAALAAQVIDARLDQFDPLPAQPVRAVLTNEYDRDFHAHPEGVLHSRRAGSGFQLRTTYTVVNVATDQMQACKALLSQ